MVWPQDRSKWWEGRGKRRRNLLSKYCCRRPCCGARGRICGFISLKWTANLPLCFCSLNWPILCVWGGWWFLNKCAVAAEGVCSWAHPRHLLFYTSPPLLYQVCCWGRYRAVQVHCCQLQLYLRNSGSVSAMWKEWKEPRGFTPVLSCHCSEMLIPFATEKLALKDPPRSCKWIYSTDCCVVFVTTMAVSGSWSTAFCYP